jgi:hypothetical protein
MRHSHAPYHFHHGMCVGADDEAAEDAAELGYWTIAWPGAERPDLRHTRVSNDYRGVLPNLERNKIIAQTVEVMTFTPKQETEVLRSGTWATVRYARAAGTTAYIVQPSGRIDKEWQAPVAGRLVDRKHETNINLRGDRP